MKGNETLVGQSPINDGIRSHQRRLRRETDKYAYVRNVYRASTYSVCSPSEMNRNKIEGLTTHESNVVVRTCSGAQCFNAIVIIAEYLVAIRSELRSDGRFSHDSQMFRIAPASEPSSIPCPKTSLSTQKCFRGKRKFKPISSYKELTLCLSLCIALYMHTGFISQVSLVQLFLYKLWAFLGTDADFWDMG